MSHYFSEYSKKQIADLFVLSIIQNICLASALSPGSFFWSILAVFFLIISFAFPLSSLTVPGTENFSFTHLSEASYSLSFALDIISVLSCYAKGIPHAVLTRFHWIHIAKINSSKIGFWIGLNSLLSILMHFVSFYSTFIVIII